jgi:PAS domain-containing protein
MLPLHQWLVLDQAETDENSAHGRLLASLPCDWLFMASDEPVLIVDATTGHIAEANPPAAMLFRTSRADLVGTRFLSAFDHCCFAALQSSLHAALSTGTALIANLRAQHGDAQMSARLSLFRSPSATYWLVRLTSTIAERVSDDACGAGSAVFRAVDNAPVGFLITDAEFVIDYANRLFIDMVRVTSSAAVRGSSLLQWLTLTQEDLARLGLQLSQRQAVAQLKTRLNPRDHIARDVEVCAIPVPDGPDPCWGFSVSELPRLN